MLWNIDRVNGKRYTNKGLMEFLDRVRCWFISLNCALQRESFNSELSHWWLLLFDLLFFPRWTAKYLMRGLFCKIRWIGCLELLLNPTSLLKVIFNSVRVVLKHYNLFKNKSKFEVIEARSHIDQWASSYERCIIYLLW